MRARALLALALLSGCDRELSFGTLQELGDGGAESDAAPGDAAEDRTFHCQQRGPLYPTRDSRGNACPESLGHHYALCSCQELWNDMGGILVDGFDSRRAPYVAGERSGSVAIHGPLFAAAGAQIGGSLFVGGALPLAGDLDVGGNLAVGGTIDRPFAVTVAGSATFARDVRVQSLAVGEGITVAQTSQVSLDVPYSRGPVDVPLPCECGEQLDRTALLAEAKNENDNASIGLASDASLRAESMPLEFALPCGRYWLREIYGARALTLRIQGRVALYIDDRILLDPDVPFTIALEGDAELDLFVRNGLTANGPVTIGTPSAPTRVRLYLGNERQNLYFRGPAVIAGSVYAPTADLVADSTFELYGAALVRRAGGEARILVHYDRALADDRCAAASCTSDTSCATPLRCDGARCLP